MPARLSGTNIASESVVSHNLPCRIGGNISAYEGPGRTKVPTYATNPVRTLSSLKLTAGYAPT